MKAWKWTLLVIAAMTLSAGVAWAHRMGPSRAIAAPAAPAPAPWHGGPLARGFGHGDHGGHHGFRGPGFNGGFHHHGFHSGGAIIFAPTLFAPVPTFDDPPFPSAPAPIVGEPPTVYIERADAGSDGTAATPGGVWYFCEKTGTYYPYVTECPDGWKVVPQQP